MITYYGSKISPNQLETGEGFLICRNVPIARTGVQKYRASELGLDGDPNRIVEVVRDEVEVFAPETMASFEGKPVTNNHPQEQVDPENARYYERGHVQNVRRGTGEQSDLLIGDLHIHDGELITAVKRKRKPKREISCGYDCEYVEDENGVLHQTKIRGNHVAVVDSGRAGSRVAIVDNSIDTPTEAERTNGQMKNNKFSILKLFGLAAKNTNSDEELDALVTDTGEALTEGETLTEGEQESVVEAVADAPLDLSAVVELIKGLDAKLDGIANALVKETPETDESETESVEAVTEEEKPETIEDALTNMGEESAVIEATEEEATDACNKDTALDSAVQTHILASVQDAINGITDEAQKQAVTDAILGAVRVTKDDMSALISGQETTPVHKEVTNEEVQSAYDAMNPHKKN